MKIRNGFVSNSSSSSFIISAEKSKEKKFKIFIEMDISNLIDLIVTTEEELKDAFIEQYSLSYYFKEEDTPFLDVLEDEGLLEEYEQCLEELKQGKEVIFLSASSDDYEGASQYIHYNGLDKNSKLFTIIKNNQ